MLTPHTLAELRRQFPVVSRVTYLDTAAVGISPPVVVDAGLAALQAKSDPTASRTWEEGMVACLRQLADYLGTSPEAVVLTSNTTEGINLVASSLAWRPGDEVLVNDADFPSNIYPWARLQAAGVTLNVAHVTPGARAADAILRAVTPHTRLVAVSHVFMNSGWRTDLTTLGAELHEQGILLSVDGMQAVGFMKPELSQVDFYAASIYKGLLGPFGVGFLAVNPAVAESLSPTFVGYNSLAHRYRLGDEQFAWAPGARRLAFGHANYVGAEALRASLQLLGGLGWENVHDTIRSLTGYAIDRLSARSDVRVITPQTPEERLAIVCFDVVGYDPADVHRHLRDAGVWVSVRDGHIRASFHIYNAPEDIDHLVDELGSLRAR